MKILLSEQQLRDGVRRMADDVNHAYQGNPLTIVGVMTGSIILLADMVRLLEMPLRVGVVQASSYRGEVERGALSINSDVMPNIADRDVLVVDDIFDTGNTLVELLSLMSQQGPASIRTGVLLLKAGRQEVDLRPDFVAFTIPDEFVVGYGLDYHDEYRNLPYVASLDEHELDVTN